MSREKPDYGPAVLDGVVRYTSVSALTTFDPLSYGGCPRRWFFKYVQKKQEPTTKALKLGTDIHDQIEHFLVTTEDVLGPFARAGKHFLPKPGLDLIVEKPFGDVKKAITLRGKGLLYEAEDCAGLVADGIPLAGFIDVRHSRGEYIDSAGTLRREIGNRVIEVIDHKSTSNLDYAKSEEELRNAIQMVGYANIKDVRLNADFARVSHIYYQTRSTPAAKKVTTLIPVAEAQKKWERVHGLGRFMKDVAKETDAEKVDTQLDSCDSYRIGCPHKSYCPRPTRNVFDLLQIRGENNMGNGLFDTLKAGHSNGASLVPPIPTAHPTGLFGGSAPAPVMPLPSPPLSEIEHRAVVDAERARLQAEDAKSETVTFYGNCKCGETLTSLNASKLQNGTIKHFGCPQAAPPHIGAINPPDAPKPDPIAAAAPLPPEVIATITNPELKAKAESHAAAAAARAAAAPADGKEKKVGNSRCSGGGQKIMLSMDAMAEKKTLCPVCKKELKLKPEKEGDQWFAVLAGHITAKVEIPVVVPIVVPPLPPTVTPVPSFLPPVPTVMMTPEFRKKLTTSVPSIVNRVESPSTGISVFVDVIFEKGDQPKSLDEYIADMVKTIETKANVPDIRCAPDKHDLAFGKWKGFLSACVKFDPPKPGSYVLYGVSTSEIKQVVLEALTPIATQVIRAAGR